MRTSAIPSDGAYDVDKRLTELVTGGMCMGMVPMGTVETFLTLRASRSSGLTYTSVGTDANGVLVSGTIVLLGDASDVARGCSS